MLTVFSDQDSGLASTMAMHLAACWASSRKEVLLIEAQIGGSLLKYKMDIHHSPGLVSFLASGLPPSSQNLIDHSQDVLFNTLHVMPAPHSPAGARRVTETLCEHADDLRNISANEMAVIIEAGDITAESLGIELTRRSAGFVVIVNEDSELSALAHLEERTDSQDAGAPQGFAVSIGASAIPEEEWESRFGLTYCGSVAKRPKTHGDLADLAIWMSKNKKKRKHKASRRNLEEVASKLYPYARPPAREVSALVEAEQSGPEKESSAAGSAAATEDPLGDTESVITPQSVPGLPQQPEPAERSDDMPLKHAGSDQVPFGGGGGELPASQRGGYVNAPQVGANGGTQDQGQGFPFFGTDGRMSQPQPRTEPPNQQFYDPDVEHTPSQPQQGFHGQPAFGAGGQVLPQSRQPYPQQGYLGSGVNETMPPQTAPMSYLPPLPQPPQPPPRSHLSQQLSHPGYPDYGLGPGGEVLQQPQQPGYGYSGYSPDGQQSQRPGYGYPPYGEPGVEQPHLLPVPPGYEYPVYGPGGVAYAPPQNAPPQNAPPQNAPPQNAPPQVSEDVVPEISPSGSFLEWAARLHRGADSEPDYGLTGAGGGA